MHMQMTTFFAARDFPRRESLAKSTYQPGASSATATLAVLNCGCVAD